DELPRPGGDAQVPGRRVREHPRRRALAVERPVQRRRPHAEPDGGRGRGDRHCGGDRGRERAPRADRDDVLRLGPGRGEDAAAQRLRRRRPLDGEGERRPRLAERPEPRPAVVALVEVLLEPLAVRAGQRVERVEGGELVDVFGHTDPARIRPVAPGGSAPAYSSGWFWTLCSVAYSFVRLFTTARPSLYA